MSDKTLADLLALPAPDIYELRQIDAHIAALRGPELDWIGGKPYYIERDAEGYHLATNPVPHYRGAIQDAWPLLAEMLAAGVEFIVSARHPAGTLLLVPCVPDDVPELSQVKVPTLADAPLAIVRVWATWFYGKRGE